MTNEEEQKKVATGVTDGSLWRKRQEPERSMKVEGPLHVVCQCDQCKAQPEQEPVAWYVDFGNEDEPNYACVGEKPDDEPTATVRPLVYGDTTPPQRTWVGLTPQERDEINEQVYGAVPHHVAFHHAIEAKLKEKNT